MDDEARLFPALLLGAGKDDATVTCLFATSELPQPNGKLETARGRKYRFAVSPANCYGEQGAAIRSNWITA